MRLRDLLIVLCLLAVRAFALPALSGPTGLAILPTAAVSEHGGVMTFGVGNGAGARSLQARVVHNTAFGEVGLLYAHEGVDITGASVKAVRPLPGGRASAALGGLLLHTDAIDTTAAYLAATRALPWGDVTGGVTWTRVAGAGAADALRPYAGVRLALPDGARLTLEYQAKGDGLYEAHPITAVMFVREYGLLTLTIGSTNAVGLLGAAETHVVAGVSAPFGGIPW
jgi:hypothetical protein